MCGFGLRWDDGSHRISRWGVFPRIGFEHLPDGCPGTSTISGAALVAEIVGGPETLGLNAPGAEVSATYHVIGAQGGTEPMDAGMWNGVRIARGERSIDLLASAEAESPVLFDLALAGMADAPSVVVVLDGLELRTDVPQGATYPADYDAPDGYSSRGIGAAIANVERQANELRFDVRARFELGLRDRDAMNRAVPVANTRAFVHYAVIALPAEPARGSVHYREDHRAHGDSVLAVCRPDPSVTALTIQGSALPRAAPALSSFALRLFPDEETIGDDVRELSIRIQQFDYDATNGQATMHVEGYASNEGPPPPFRAMQYEVDAEVVLLAWSGTDPSVELSLRAPIVVGRNEMSLPMTPN